MYYQVSDTNASQDTSGATNYKDEEWATWTCTLGWPVQGIWEPGLDGTDINSTSWSYQKHDGYQLLATGNDKG